MADSATPKKPEARTALGKAWEARDYATFLREVEGRARREGECLIWKGKQVSGYPLVKVARRWRRVHRMVAEANAGKPLGVLTAHHICGVSLCVRPEHLTSATQAANVAEMLARRSYLARIAELESALRSIAPGHEALMRAAA
ncbi:HNH endonuclease [Nocardia vinacea]|uniref:HNH endonuclease n=1 Tax=Nocardia vinacea TaxID=96468 RepID=UPI003402A850